MKKTPPRYEGYSFMLDSFLSTTSEMTKIIISYLPVVSHAMTLVNAILNMTLTMIGLYLFYRIFLSTVLTTFYEFVIHLKVVFMGRDNDYANLRRMERCAFLMYLQFQSRRMEYQLMKNFSGGDSIIQTEHILNTLLNNPDDSSPLFNELEQVSLYVMKSSMEDKYLLKDKKFIENHLEIKTCIEALFRDTQQRFRNEQQTA